MASRWWSWPARIKGRMLLEFAILGCLIWAIVGHPDVTPWVLYGLAVMLLTLAGFALLVGLVWLECLMVDRLAAWWAGPSVRPPHEKSGPGRGDDGLA